MARVNEAKLEANVQRLRAMRDAALETASNIASSYPAGASDAQTLVDDAETALAQAENALAQARGGGDDDSAADDDAVAGGVFERDPREWLRWAGDRAARLEDRVAQLPTPGGVAPLLLVLIVLVWAIVAVTPQGMTRLMLVWYTVTGRTRLTTSREPGQTGLPLQYDPTPASPSGPWGQPYAPTPNDQTYNEPMPGPPPVATPDRSGETFNPLSGVVDWSIQ